VRNFGPVGNAGIAAVFAMVLSVSWCSVCMAFEWPTLAIYAGAVVIGGGVGASIVVAWR
jgi:hypothetical protein